MKALRAPPTLAMLIAVCEWKKATVSPSRVLLQIEVAVVDIL
jgi:hypothetical protein